MSVTRNTFTDGQIQEARAAIRNTLSIDVTIRLTPGPLTYLISRFENGVWSSPVPVDEGAYLLFNAVMWGFLNINKAKNKVDELQAQLDGIARQRDKWRKSKQRQRGKEVNPARHDPRQESIYGTSHTQELSGEIPQQI